MVRGMVDRPHSAAPVHGSSGGPMSYPEEHNKLDKVAHLSQAIYDFMEWAAETHHLHLAYYDEGRSPFMLASHIPVKDLLAEHFGIDLSALEEEKREILDIIRTANEKEDHD